MCLITQVFLVDPREEKPSQRELELVYEEQIQRQKVALESVQRIEKVVLQMLARLNTSVSFFSRRDYYYYATRRRWTSCSKTG